jgi:predicted nucleic acid-binding protein
VSTFLCDTTVLFAASDAAHRHHSVCLDRVISAVPGEAFVAAHSLAELYATLSAVSPPRMRRLDQVLAAVEHAATVFTPVVLREEDYLWVVRHAAKAGSRSGQIYDALILKCAERAKTDIVYTLNLDHFRSVAWPGMVRRIRPP